MPLREENCKGFGIVGGCTVSESIDDTITSNLAYDKYQGLFAYGTRDGHIKMYSMKGYEQEVLNAHDNIPVMFITFVPGECILFSIDARNRLAVRDLRRSYQAEEVKKEEQKHNIDLNKSQESDLTSIMT